MAERLVCALAAALLATGCGGGSGVGDPDAGPDRLGDPGADGGAEASDAAASECPATALAAGTYHACAARSDGTVACWGGNSEGQLGDGTFFDRDLPATVPGVADAVAVAAGLGHSCALGRDGVVRCWGRGFEGQLGGGIYGSGAAPKPVMDLPATAVEIVAGSYFTCARLGDGTVSCWGLNQNGELGDGTETSSNLPRALASLGTDVAQISAGQYHACALKKDATLWCWGYGGSGAVGDGTYTLRRLPIPVIGLEGAVLEVAASGRHTCARTAGARVFCWGDGSHGALGDGSPGYSPSPTEVVVGGLGPIKIEKLWPAGESVCVRRSDKNVWCWGRNDLGQLGDGSDADRFLPVRVAALGEGVIQMTGGFLHTCALDLSGRATCAGHDGFGQLGDGQAAVLSPIAAATSAGGVTAAGAGELHTCATTADGAAACWGGNDFGQVGDGTLVQRPSPVGVVNFAGGVTRFALGPTHSCARRGDGTAFCWGNNFHGELGDGTTNYSTEPVAVAVVGNRVVDIVAGEGHTCALLDTGNVGCWGNNSAGQLGTGNKALHRTAFQVEGLGFDVAAIAAGGLHGCAIKTDGTAWCWGANYLGELGDGTAMTRLQPVPVPGAGAGLREIVAGYFFNCARRVDGRVVCWGDNRAGQQGYGTVGFTYEAHEVAGLVGPAARLAAGRDHACALREDGQVLCWGEGRYGQLGDGRRVASAVPVVVKGLPGPAVAITAGGRHSCALGADGVLRCWGWNGDGQLGDGNGGHRTRHAPIALCP